MFYIGRFEFVNSRQGPAFLEALVTSLPVTLGSVPAAGLDQARNHPESMTLQPRCVLVIGAPASVRSSRIDQLELKIQLLRPTMRDCHWHGARSGTVTRMDRDLDDAAGPIHKLP